MGRSLSGEIGRLSLRVGEMVDSVDDFLDALLGLFEAVADSISPSVSSSILSVLFFNGAGAVVRFAAGVDVGRVATLLDVEVAGFVAPPTDVLALVGLAVPVLLPTMGRLGGTEVVAVPAVDAKVLLLSGPVSVVFALAAALAVGAVNVLVRLAAPSPEPGLLFSLPSLPGEVTESTSEFVLAIVFRVALERVLGGRVGGLLRMLLPGVRDVRVLERTVVGLGDAGVFDTGLRGVVLARREVVSREEEVVEGFLLVLSVAGVPARFGALPLSIVAAVMLLVFP